MGIVLCMTVPYMFLLLLNLGKIICETVFLSEDRVMSGSVNSKLSQYHHSAKFKEK